MAVGRQANVDGLGLAELGIAIGPEGVAVDDRGRTSVRTIYVAGDAAGRHQLAHVAAHEAVQAVRDAFFPGRRRRTALVPWCTFTDPELAHAGLTVAEAEARHGESVDVWQVDLARSDRARAEGASDGALLVVTAKGRIVGAHLLAPAAGELIHELALAIDRGMKLADVAEPRARVPDVLDQHRPGGRTRRLFERAQKLRWLVRRDKDARAPDLADRRAVARPPTAQRAIQPPSTMTLVPVMNEPASEARRSRAPSSSWASPIRGIGEFCWM